jgi:hypothetical protein
MANYAVQKFFPAIRASATYFEKYDAVIIIYCLEWQFNLSR